MSAITQLTPNGIKTLCEAKNPNSELRDRFIVLQVTDVKLFQPGENKKNIKSRLTISDGVSSCISMITEKVDKQMNGKDIDKYSIIRMDGTLYQASDVNSRKVIIFKSAPQIVYTGLKRSLGNPQDYSKNLENSTFHQQYDLKIPIQETDQKRIVKAGEEDSIDSIPSSFDDNFNRLNIKSPLTNNRQEEEKQPTPNIPVYGSANQPRFSSGTTATNTSTGTNLNQSRTRMSSIQDMYTPIRILNQFTTDWRIRARVTKKYDIKQWRNQKGEGLLMNIELMDKDNVQIQATFFGEACNKFGPMLQENKVYLFANGSIKIANTKYTSIKNDHCITFDMNADIQEVEDDKQIKQQGFSFIPLQQIQEMVQQQAVDVIGVIVEVGPVNSINLKTGSQKERRHLMLADESGLKIQSALWGSLANQFDYQTGQIVAIKNARVSDFGGKSLNCGDDHSIIYIEPNHQRTLDLQKWHAMNEGQTLQSLSGQGGSGDGQGRDNYRLIEELIHQINHDQTFLSGQNPQQYFKISGYLQRIICDDNRQMYFIGCPHCKKKVQQDGDYFRCEPCGKSLASHEVRVTYTIVGRLNDFTDSLYVQFIGEQGDVVTGMKASDFKNMRESGQYPLDQMSQALNNQNFNYFTAVIKARVDDFNQNSDQVRFRYQSMRIQPIDFKEENQMLLRRLQLYSNK